MSSVRLDNLKVTQGYEKEATHDKPVWSEIPKWKKGAGSRFLDLARVEGGIVDRILSQPILNLRDHLAIAATCRSLRAGYSYIPPTDSWIDRGLHSPLWKGLIKLRPLPEEGKIRCLDTAKSERDAIAKIWSNGKKIDTNQFAILIEDDKKSILEEKKRAFYADDDSAERSIEWNEAIKIIHSSRISKTKAKQVYGLGEKEIEMYLKCILQKNAQKKNGGAALYLEAAVDALALRLKDSIEKRRAIAAKSKRTKEKNGTNKSRKGAATGSRRQNDDDDFEGDE